VKKILFFLMVILLVTAIDLFHWEVLPNASRDMTGTLSAEPYSVLDGDFLGSMNDPGFNPAVDIQNSGDDTSMASAPFLDPVTMILLGSGLIGLVGLGRKKILTTPD
jgi:hypothetical protein